MNVEEYLLKQGWKKGHALQPGGIKNPILVAHKSDMKGLGFNPQASEGWWERVFDGHLKALDFSSKGNSKPQFEFDEEQRRRNTSPLYAQFRSAGMLEGSIKNTKQENKLKKSSSKDKKEKKEKEKSKRNKRSSSDNDDTKKDKHSKRKRKEKSAKREGKATSSSDKKNKKRKREDSADS